MLVAVSAAGTGPFLIRGALLAKRMALAAAQISYPYSLPSWMRKPPYPYRAPTVRPATSDGMLRVRAKPNAPPTAQSPAMVYAGC